MSDKTVSLTINTETPEVLEKIREKLVDSVLEQIPQDFINAFAEKVIDGKAIVYTSYNHYGKQTVEYSLSNETARILKERFEKEIPDKIKEYINNEEVKKLIEDMHIEAFRFALENLPKALADKFTNRLLGNMGFSFNNNDISFSFMNLNSRLDSVIQAIKSGDRYAIDSMQVGGQPSLPLD